MKVLLLLLFGVMPETPPLDATGHDNQMGLTFSPDGRTAYWTAWNGKWGSKGGSPQTIYVSYLAEAGWSAPAIAPFSGKNNDGDPFVSPDGRWVYFVSDRSGNDDIWRFDLQREVVEHLSISSSATEYSPVVVDSGALYFASARDGGAGRGDIYRAAAEGDAFAPPELVGQGVNSETGEWNVWVSRDESVMIFEASSRPTNISVPGDLYCSRHEHGDWSEAVPIETLNSADSDLMLRVHPDGTIYYTIAPIGGHAKIEEIDRGALAGCKSREFD